MSNKLDFDPTFTNMDPAIGFSYCSDMLVYAYSSTVKRYLDP